MSTTDELSNEDLENVALVRMEDIQPARDRSVEYNSPEVEDQEVETCVVESIDYDSVCVVNDDSDIRRTMSIHSKDDESGEYPVYEVKQEVVHEDSKPVKANLPDSWPTLEILPGGVIKHADRLDDDYNTLYSKEIDSDNVNMEDLMYACAKCSQKFKYLFCLVKHVKWHENEEKKIKSNIKCLKNEYVNKKTKNGVTTRQKKRKVEIIVARAVPRLEHLLTHGKKNVHTKL